jgi:hypothetical protein
VNNTLPKKKTKKVSKKRLASSVDVTDQDFADADQYEDQMEANIQAFSYFNSKK